MPKLNLKHWVKAVFAHPTSEPEWYWDKDFDDHWDALGLSDALTVEYMTGAFLDPAAKAVFTGTSRTSDMVLNRRIVPRTMCTHVADIWHSTSATDRMC